MTKIYFDFRSPEWSTRFQAMGILFTTLYTTLPELNTYFGIPNNTFSSFLLTIYAILIPFVLYHIIVCDDMEKARNGLLIPLGTCVLLSYESFKSYDDVLGSILYVILALTFFVVIMRDECWIKKASSSIIRVMISLIIFSFIQLIITGAVKYCAEVYGLGQIPISAHYSGLISGAMGTCILIGFSPSWYPHPTRLRHCTKIGRGVYTILGSVTLVALLVVLLKGLGELKILEDLYDDHMGKIIFVTSVHFMCSVSIVFAATWLFRRENRVMTVIWKIFAATIAALIAALLITSFSRYIFLSQNYEDILHWALVVELLPMLGLIVASVCSNCIQLCVLKPSDPH